MESPLLQERAESLLRQGQAAAQAGQQELARRYLQAAVDIEPNNATAWLWLAGVQEPAEAHESLKKVLELDPTNSRARAGLAWVERQLPPSSQLASQSSPPSATDALHSLGKPPSRTTGSLAAPASPPAPDERGTRALSIEQELRARFRDAQAEPASEVDTNDNTPEIPNRPRLERPVVTLPVEEGVTVDPAAQRYRLLFLLFSVLFVIGTLLLAATLFGLI